MGTSIVHKIGTFDFIQMSPAPPNQRQRVLVETRNGVDGSAVWLLGKRGEIWSPRTVRDTATHSAAITLKQSYEDACGSKVSVTYADTVFADVVIKDVQVFIRDQVFGVGGFESTPQAIVIAQWQLIVD